MNIKLNQELNNTYNIKNKLININNINIKG